MNMNWDHETYFFIKVYNCIPFFKQQEITRFPPFIFRKRILRSSSDSSDPIHYLYGMETGDQRHNLHRYKTKAKPHIIKRSFA